jgi:hypothetical protein
LIKSKLAKQLPRPVEISVLPPSRNWKTEKLVVVFGDPPSEPWYVFEDSGGVEAMVLSGRQVFVGYEGGFEAAISAVIRAMVTAS